MKTTVYRMVVCAVGGARRHVGQNRQLRMLSLHRPAQRDEYVRAQRRGRRAGDFVFRGDPKSGRWPRRHGSRHAHKRTERGARTRRRRATPGCPQGARAPQPNDDRRSHLSSRSLPVRQVQLCYIPLQPDRNRPRKLSPWNVMSVPLYQRLECLWGCPGASQGATRLTSKSLLLTRFRHVT